MNPIPLIIRAAVVCLGLTAASFAAAGTPLVSTVQEIESRLNARVGIAVSDQETGRAWRYHADQRFPLASTFKALACGAKLTSHCCRHMRNRALRLYCGLSMSQTRG